MGEQNRTIDRDSRQGDLAIANFPNGVARLTRQAVLLPFSMTRVNVNLCRSLACKIASWRVLQGFGERLQRGRVLKVS
jgi:hypothetical protein